MLLSCTAIAKVKARGGKMYFWCSLVQDLQSSSSGKSGLVVGEGIKGELAVIGTTPTVSHTSKWHVVHWTEEMEHHIAVTLLGL